MSRPLESVVDDAVMDHHRQLSHLQPDSLRAFGDHHGKRRNDPRFVTAASLDPDADFATAGLAGIVPAPDDADSQRAQAIIEVIAHLYTDPIGADLTGEEGFGYLKPCSQLPRSNDPRQALDLSGAGAECARAFALGQEAPAWWC